ncbi:MAG: hypothetical protein KAS91_00280, partial [Candidatus Pacebacteria bacterium]|nr:hypothetical protein [Candidatus Paceibacterota bacterium]
VRESNSRLDIGNVVYYHYTNPAILKFYKLLLDKSIQTNIFSFIYLLLHIIIQISLVNLCHNVKVDF